jgi:hypothetical protein
MMRTTVNFLRDVCGKETIKGTSMLSELLGKVLYLFKRTYPSLDLGNNSLTMAFSAMEFMLNAETYFTKRGSRSGRSFFNSSKSEFLKHFDYESVIKKIDKGDSMLFLYHPLGNGQRKLSAHGVIGEFLSFDHSYEDGNSDQQDAADSAVITVNLEISNKGIIGLPITDMVYFGKWYGRKLELVI